MKRKRGKQADSGCRHKRSRIAEECGPHITANPVLRLYYPKVSTLRDHLASKLAKASKSRRRILANCGRSGEADDESGIGKLLDSILVGTFVAQHEDHDRSLPSQDQEFSIFSQQLSESTERSTASGSALSQSEVGYEAVPCLCEVTPALSCCQHDYSPVPLGCPEAHILTSLDC